MTQEYIDEQMQPLISSSAGQSEVEAEEKREADGSTRTRYNVDFLNYEERTDTFQLTLNNKHEVSLQDLIEEENFDTQLQHVKETWTSTCEQVLGKKSGSHMKLSTKYK